MGSVLELRGMCSHWYWSKLRNSFRIFSEVWGLENTTSHMAMPVLQARALGEQGCRSLSSVAWEGPAGGRACLLLGMPRAAGEG